MKKIILVLPLLSMATAQASSDFVCKATYDEKISRMEKNHDWREFGKVAGMVGIGGGIVLTWTVTAPLTAVEVIFGAMPATAAFLGLPIHGLMNSLDREPGIRAAYSAQQLMNLSYQDLISQLEIERSEHAENAVKAFDNQMSYPDTRSEYVHIVNEERRSHGLPYLEASIVIADARKKVSDDIMAKPILVENAVTKSLQLAKKKDTQYATFSYDQWRDVLMENQARFCEHGKAKTLRKATLSIIDRI